jgi:hypothetical protein
VTMIGTERPDTKVEVILGVDTPGLPHGGGRGPSGQAPERVEPTNDRKKGLREAPVLGGGLWPREVCWDRRYQQLRGRARPPLKGRWDFSDGGRET